MAVYPRHHRSGESFALGLKALQFSANQFMEEEGEAELTPWEMTVMITLALGMTVLLFIVLPSWLESDCSLCTGSVLAQFS